MKIPAELVFVSQRQYFSFILLVAVINRGQLGSFLFSVSIKISKLFLIELLNTLKCESAPAVAKMVWNVLSGHEHFKEKMLATSSSTSTLFSNMLVKVSGGPITFIFCFLLGEVQMECFDLTSLITTPPPPPPKHTNSQQFRYKLLNEVKITIPRSCGRTGLQREKAQLSSWKEVHLEDAMKHM